MTQRQAYSIRAAWCQHARAQTQGCGGATPATRRAAPMPSGLRDNGTAATIKRTATSDMGDNSGNPR